jgi:hypothetical protein
VAVSDAGPDPRRGDDQGLTPAFAAVAVNVTCDEAGRVWTGSPQGFDAVKKMGPILPASPDRPVHAGYGCGLYTSRPDMR